MGWIIGRGNSFIFRQGGGNKWSSYWSSRLDTWHNSIIGDDFIDSVSSLNASRLPICNIFNGTNDVAEYSIANWLEYESSGEMTAFVYVKDDGGQNYVFSSVDKGVSNKYCNFIVRTVPTINIRGLTNNWINGTAITEGWHTIIFGSTGSAYYITVDGVPQSLTVISGANDGRWFNTVANRNNVAIGASLDTTPTYGKGRVGWVKYGDGTNGYWICNNRNYIYDVSGKGYHMTFAGTGKRITGISGAYNYNLINGYTLYGKQNSISIQVPRLASGTKIISPTLPADYIEINDVAGVLLGHNNCDMIIDFDPGNTADSKLDVFDKSNSTIHIATGSMVFYDTDNPYLWLITELFDPRIYFTYFNIGYRGRVYAKITSKLVSALYYPITYEEQLNCTLDQTLIDEWKAFQYCGIDDYAEMDIDGNPVYDGNDYVVII